MMRGYEMRRSTETSLIWVKIVDRSRGAPVEFDVVER